MNWDSSVSDMTGVELLAGTIIFSLPPYPYWLWGPPTFLPNVFPNGKNKLSMKLCAHHQPVTSLRICRASLIACDMKSGWSEVGMTGTKNASTPAHRMHCTAANY